MDGNRVAELPGGERERRPSLPALSDDEELSRYLTERRNWSRWGPNDERGAANLITSRKIREAAGCVRKGRTVSLSRPFPTTPGPHNPRPAQMHPGTWTLPGGAGIAHDFIGVEYHGFNTTHLDALCHVWDADGMWNGRHPTEVLGSEGANFADVDRYGDGITTRGVLLDVARYRDVPFVAPGKPVRGRELLEVASSQNVTIRPGDALVVHSGRTAWEATLDPSRPVPEDGRPGLHASCLGAIRELDAALLVWDLMEEKPGASDLPFTVHAALFAFGVPLVDNARLDDLAELCEEEGRYEFLLMVAPLRVAGGTGSPVNPIAVL